jgi:enoyl-CoA hydratase
MTEGKIDSAGSDNPRGYGADFREEGNPEEWVLYEKVDEHIAKITLNRPERRNAILVPDMQHVLQDRIKAATDDDEVKVVILAGAGDHFCGGDDVRRMPVESAGLKKGSRLPQTARIQNAVRLNHNLMTMLYATKHIVSACQGAVVGSGLNFAMASDIIVASEGAYFARPQARIGFAGFSTALPLMLLKMGINRGYEMLITGRRVSSHEMKDWGVVSSVVPEDQLEDEAMRYAKAIALHSADGLMIGKIGMQMFWDLVGMSSYGSFVKTAHPLFTNIVWRDDEANFFKERNRLGHRESLREVYRQWEDLGFK